MSYAAKLQSAFAAVESTKRQVVPKEVQARLLLLAQSNQEHAPGYIQTICDGLTFYAETLKIPAFNFSPLEIRWPTHPQADLTHYAMAINYRNAITEQLEKDGVALIFHIDNAGARCHVTMEDMKGRVHPLFGMTPKSQGMQPVSFKPPHGSPIEINAMDVRELASFHTQLPEDAIKQFEPLLSQLMILNPRGSLFNPSLTPLWKCDNSGVPHSNGGKNAFVIVANIASNNTHEQCRKVAPNLIDYLANASRIGPTQSTISKAMTQLLADHKDAAWTPEGLRTELEIATQKFAGGAIGSRLTEPFLSNLANQLQKYPPAQRHGLLIDAVMRSGVMFNARADVRRKHTPLTSENPAKSIQTDPASNKHSHKAATAAPDKNTLPKQPESLAAAQEAALMAQFEQYRKSLTGPQMARKLLETAHPFGVLPLNQESIVSINSIVDTMMRTPSRAEHGIRWLMDIVRDVQLSMLEQVTTAPTTPGHVPNEYHYKPKR